MRLEPVARGTCYAVTTREEERLAEDKKVEGVHFTGANRMVRTEDSDETESVVQH